MQINLEENEINAILAILGDMPSKSGTWTLIFIIKGHVPDLLGISPRIARIALISFSSRLICTVYLSLWCVCFGCGNGTVYGREVF